MKFSDSDALSTQEFFTKAYPDPQPKNLRTQLGVHFEEIAEMMAQLDAQEPGDQMLLSYLGKAMEQCGEHLKNTNGAIYIKDRVEFADSLGDQMVTAVGVGHMASMNMPGIYGEVNRSNLSKFDDNGEPILDNNLKLVKGPKYFKPDLQNFV